MRLIGFSTGALAYGDFTRGVDILRQKATVIELSALREPELGPLVRSLDSLDLSGFRYISVHAPSKFDAAREKEIIRQLEVIALKKWPIILHPDAIYDYAAWRHFGSLLLVENMDKRNTRGRTAVELSDVFEQLPDAGLCLDVGHCRQVDPTMNECCLILREFKFRLRQLHISEVNARSTHDPLSASSISAFERIAHLIPSDVPAVLESPVAEWEIEAEIGLARNALTIGPRKKHFAAMQPATV